MCLFDFLAFLQAFQLWKHSPVAEAGLAGVAGGLKDQEVWRSLEGKDAGASRQRAAPQLWQEQWRVQQQHLQQHMLLMDTVFLKVSVCIAAAGRTLLGHTCPEQKQTLKEGTFVYFS